MKNVNRELLGFSVPVVGIAETLQEAITAAGSEEAVLKDFNNNVLAHSHYTILRRVIVKVLEAATGVKRKGTGEGENFKVTEKDGDYIERLELELGEEGLKAHAAVVAEACEKIPVDYTPSVRGAGTGDDTPAKKWLAYADKLKEVGKYDLFIAKHEITGDNDEEVRFNVARKAREIVLAAQQAAAANALSV